jgi:cytochrome c oxidase assembly protein subunit 15
MNRFAKILGVAATVGMFVVLVMGATVTNTGSEHGCGKSWPLCNGAFVPQFAVSTAIEYTHRAVVGVETPLILGLAAVAWYLYRRRREIQILAPLMVLFLFLQAGLGAWAVMYPQLAPVLALHFGVSLVAFASVLLTTVFLFEVEGRESLRDRPIPSLFRYAVWAVAGYSYVVVYLGAFVRHIDADEACSGWPLCNGVVVPGFTAKVAAAFTHRVAAGLLVLAIAALFIWSRRLRADRPDLVRGAAIALLLVVLQAASGAIVAFTEVDLFSALAHAGLIGLLFASLTYLCMHTIPRLGEQDVGITSPRLQRPQPEVAGVQR